MENFKGLDWKDIKRIVNVAESMVDLDCQDMLPEICKTEEEYYNEIISKLNQAPKSGVELIKEEREKQINRHGYTVESDAGYKHGELLMGALAYLNSAIYGPSVGTEDWPFEMMYFKEENDDVEYLKKAGAFIAADIDRRNFIKKQGEQ